MALDKATLKAALKTAFSSAVGTDDNYDTIAGDIADAIETFVKSGQVNAGITLTTPDTINGSTTGTGTIS